MPGFKGFGPKMVEREMVRRGTQQNPGMAGQISRMRLMGAPVPSMAQMMGFGVGETAQRQGGMGKVLGGIGGAAMGSRVAPKQEPTAGRRFTLRDMFGMRR